MTEVIKNADGTFTTADIVTGPYLGGTNQVTAKKIVVPGKGEVYMYTGVVKNETTEVGK